MGEGRRGGETKKGEQRKMYSSIKQFKKFKKEVSSTQKLMFTICVDKEGGILNQGARVYDIQLNQGVRSTEDGITGGFELLDVGAGN